MFFIYRPKGEDEQVFDYDPGDINNKRARELESAYARLSGERKTWDEIQPDVIRGGAVARTVMLWHYLSQQHPRLRVDDVEFRTGEVKVEFSREELQAMIDVALKAPASADRDLNVAGLTLEMATARPAGKDPADAQPAPDSPSPTSGTTGGSGSGRSSTSARASRKRS